MYDAYTPGAQRALDRAQVRARARGGSSVEPVDLLAALVDEAESRAAELMAQCGLDPARVLNALGMESEQSSLGSVLETLPAKPDESAEVIMPLPHTAALRAVLLDAGMQAKALDRGLHVGTEHLLAGLMAESSSAAQRLLADGLELEGLRSHLFEQLSSQSAPMLTLEEIPPLDLYDPARAVDIGRILDASANRAREGLRVVEDYARFVLDDPGLTRRLKEVRHRLAEALRGFDPDLLIGARDTREDVGTHIMTPSEQVRESPRAVLSANFKRIAEALRTLEEYGKLVDVWLSGRFEVLRYDVYTLEKLTLTAVHAYRALGEAKLMVLVGGLPTLGDLIWIVGEALAGGADIIELREKNLADRELLARAREVRILTAQAKARFILNDRPDLARLAGADGVHVGQDDLSIRDTRRIVGPNLLIGVSTHDRAQLDAAILAGAGYVGVGPVFPSATKKFSEPELAGLAFVQAAAETTNIPWFAIGGITEENVARVLAAGATRIAVSAAVVRAERPRRAAARLKARLEGREPDDHMDLDRPEEQ
ncbi:MAG: thiamine phosphate synthase [Isosphaeraceae bacterium]